MRADESERVMLGRSLSRQRARPPTRLSPATVAVCQHRWVDVDYGEGLLYPQWDCREGSLNWSRSGRCWPPRPRLAFVSQIPAALEVAPVALPRFGDRTLADHHAKARNDGGTWAAQVVLFRDEGSFERHLRRTCWSSP
jgi:hypothetical protein